MLVTNNGKLIRMPVSGTSVISRNTQGVRSDRHGFRRAGGQRRRTGETEDDEAATGGWRGIAVRGAGGID
jgi:hypothetical protein